MPNWIPCHVNRQITIGSMYAAFRESHDGSFNFAGESHNFWEIVCVLSGTVGVSLDGQIFSVPAGHAIVHKPMTFHRIWTENDSSPELVTISFDCEMNIEVSDIVYDMTDQMLAEVCEIHDEIRKKFEVSEVFVLRQTSDDAQLVINRLENFVIRLLPHSAMSDSVRSSQSGVRKYNEIVRCMTDHLSDNLTVDKIAQLCNMSASSVKQIFRRFTGKGVVQYYRRMKIDRAIALLRKDISVKEISRMLGYTDPNYFSTVFKREVGVSPTVYYEKMKNPLDETLR